MSLNHICETLSFSKLISKQHTRIQLHKWASWHQKGKTNLDLLEQEIVSGSGISWAICKSAP